MKTIKSNSIKDIPLTAEYVLMNPSNSFIQMFYRWKDVIYNDNSTEKRLQYKSSFNVWMNSALRTDETLTKIID